jgi:hypothetical protein
MKRFTDVLSKGIRGHNLAVLFAVMFAFAGLANAASPQHKVKIEHLTIQTPTEVAGTVLPAGDYEIKEVSSANGPELEFIRDYWNERASEMLQADEQEVMARVKFTEQKLASEPKHTQLVLAADNKDVIGLEIRGNDNEYVVGQQASNASNSGNYTTVDESSSGH